MTTTQVQTLATIVPAIDTATTKGGTGSIKDARPKFLLSPWKKPSPEWRNIQLQREINESCLILTMPHEITMRIFMATFPENSFSSWGSATPFLFGAICHSWRELSWSFPLLWSSVSLIVRRYTRTKNDLLREWLVRSGNLPLSIQFNMREPDVGNTSKKTKIVAFETMDIITRCSDRWRDVDFYLLAIFHPNICFVPSQLPLLVSMSIICRQPERFWKECGRKFPKIYWNAPKLQRIQFDTGLEEYLVLPLNQITNFSWLGLPSSHKCLRILQDAPDLTKYKFTSIHHRDWNQPLPNITALQLETLEVTIYNDDVALEEIFNHLTIPALNQLTIHVVNFSVSAFPYPTAFVSLMSRSGCHLTRLSLSNLILLAGQLSECLLVVPSLTELRLEKTPITSTILREFGVGPVPRTVLLPNLERFTYLHDGHTWYHAEYSALALMAASRWNYNTRTSAAPEVVQLKHVYVKVHIVGSSSWNDSESDHEELEGDKEDIQDRKLEKVDGHGPLIAKFKELIAEGMNIQIEGYMAKMTPRRGHML